MSDSWPPHGGRLAPLLARFGLPSDHPVIDFSANINPLGPPEWLGDWLGDAAAGLARYPDPDDSRAERAIAEQSGVSPEQVLVTNGGIEAIYLAAALVGVQPRGQRALIITPTFAEYAQACGHYGLDITTLGLEASFDESLDAGHGAPVALDIEAAERAMPGASVMFICRPNNPTGGLVPRADIERLLQCAERCDTTLVVDEAFIDFAPKEEALSGLLARYSRLILLRSLTKFYAVPGLRLGYLLASKENRRRAARLQMAWSVNALAKGLVAPLLADGDYAARTRAWLEAERGFPARLGALGFSVPPCHTNFYLLGADVSIEARIESTEALMGFLLRRGILARHTHNFAGLDGRWLRLALRESAANQRLFEVLADWKDERQEKRRAQR